MKSSVSSAARAAAQTLARQAGHAIQQGNVVEARRLLEAAVLEDGEDAPLWMRLCATRRALAEYGLAMDAADEALRVDPRHFPALLVRASLIEREGRQREAAIAYGLALAQAPPDSQLDPTTLGVVQRARVLHQNYLQALRLHLDRNVLMQSEQQSGNPAETLRLQQFIDTTLGLRPRTQQNPSAYFYPGLPPIEFWPREAFPWLSTFEAATPAIQLELARLLDRSADGFTPYVDYEDGIPLDQWAALNHSLDWSAFHFYHYGRQYPDNSRRCPQTMKALAGLPQPQVSGRMPAAMFSVLKPGTRIPPHTGVANFRLVVHLPLLVPGDCGFRVGNVTREWRVGEAFVFDDTIEHEAWNNSEEVRVILIADVWHPHLGAQEREWIGRTLVAMDDFNGGSSPLPL